MSKLCRIVLLIVSLAAIALSVCIFSLFYYIPFLTDTILEYQGLFPAFTNIFIGYCVFILACFFLLLITAVFSPGKLSVLTLLKDRGTLSFSKQTLESTVLHSFADVEGVTYPKVRVKLHKKPEKMKVFVKLSLKDYSKLLETSEIIQEKIEAALQAALDIHVKAINLKVTGSVTEGKLEAHENNAQGVRVE